MAWLAGLLCQVGVPRAKLTDMAETRAPKRKDYGRIALDAAQASLGAQTAAHVAVLEAADDVTTADAALAAARAHHEQTVRAHAEKTAAFAKLIGHDDAAARLGLTPAQLRTLIKPAGKPGRTTPTGRTAGTGTRTADAKSQGDSAQPAHQQTAV